MAFLDGWAEEPDPAIGRFAKAFLLATYLFMALFAYGLVRLALHGDRPLVAGDVVGPFVFGFLAAILAVLAYDGRRSLKSLRTEGSRD
jgi:hypothetical protein